MDEITTRFTRAAIVTIGALIAAGLACVVCSIVASGG
jgi:hypothetical protein